MEGQELERAWETALEAMELHLDEIRAGLEVGALPAPYEVAAPKGPLPTSLMARAKRLAQAQRDVEDLLRERMATVSAVLAGAFERSAPYPSFLDQRS
jgi:hypothetical protein